MKTSFTRTLFFSFGLSLLLLIITSIASYVSITNLLESAGKVTHTNQVIQLLEATVSTLKDAETGQRGYLLTGRPEFLEPYYGANAKALSFLNSARALLKDRPEQLKSADQLEDIIIRRFSRLQGVIDTKNSTGVVPADQLIEGKKYMDQARQIIKLMDERETRMLQQRTASLNEIAAYTPVLIILASLFAIIITVVSFLKIKTEFTQRRNLQEALQEKDIETTHRINIIQNLATQIAAGDYTIRLDEKGKDNLGILSFSLNKMAESLNHSFALLSDKEWLQKGIADLNNLMVGDPEIQSLTNKIIAFLAGYTNSQTGAFYVAENTDTLYLAGSYALRRHPKNEVIKFGEGLAGECARSGKELLLEGIPDETIYLSFATGEAKPVHLIAIPVYHENSIKGVIELASFTPFSTNYIAFLNNGMHNIGMAIASAESRKKMQELLEETQTQAEELQAQHSEMENLNMELEAQTEKLQASEEELRVQQEELLQSNQELEERSRLLEERNQVILQRNQEIQRKAEELALSTKYKSEFLANMSHELRTPLNSILLLSRLMSENKDNNLGSEELSYAKVIRSSGEGLLNLINEILDLSKIEAGKMDVEYADVQIKEVLDDMYSLFTPLAAEKSLDLRTTISLEVPAMIRTDKVRLEQILKNLLSNAIKFTSQGHISLDIKTNTNDRNYIDFSVKDTGIGIAPDKQQLVFEAFQQEDGSTRRKYGGTGLGLSITRELIRLLKGKITLHSEQGKGTEFIITLPVAELTGHRPVPALVQTKNTLESIDEDDQTKKEEPRPRYISPVAPSEIPDDRNDLKEGDKAMLIIEDDTNFAKILMDFSRKNGYKVISAVTGEQGIEFARQYKPQAILLDIMLPVKDGWEVMEALKSDAATRHIPVHIMSAMEVKKESITKGAVDYINKPVALEQLRTVFNKLEDVLSKDNKKVLIIEENPKHAKALAYFLESFNVKAEIKTNVDESVKALQNQEINCVILDMGVQGQVAYETLEALKKKPGLESLPIIVFTGKNISRSEESRIKRYADSIVVKTAHSYQRILDEVSLFLHLVSESKDGKKENGQPQTLGALHEVLKDKTILVADDDVRNIFSLTKILEQYKINVISATDGKDALKQLQKNPKVDLVLMDMMMPEMDGYEATRKIREMPRFKKMPVLAVTAKAMMGDREKCIKAGASDYISKPVDTDQLISLLRVWLYDSPGY
jgi:signal transduction histidine kinase/CheY-like chemotaxis protein/CHASE3 domain sensor protein